MSTTRGLATACKPVDAWIAGAVLAIVAMMAFGPDRRAFQGAGFWMLAGILFVLISILLVGPCHWLRDHAECEHPLRGAVGRMLLALGGCLLPALVFLLGTMFLPAPIWKRDAPAGWVDLAVKPMGIALSPFIAWALRAFYVAHVMGRQRDAPWVRCGLLVGALSAGCLTAVIGSATVATSSLAPWILVPAGTFLLYGGAWLLRLRSREGSLPETLGWSAAVVGLSALGAWASMRAHDALPDGPPEEGCFIVTAASRGHAIVVGRHGTELRGCVDSPVSRQLAVFRSFERLLRERMPRVHSRLRAIYSVAGPACARHVTTPWRADAVTIALLPAELVARLALRALREARP